MNSPRDSSVSIGGIISTHIRALRILAVATIQGTAFILLEAPDCAATVQERCLIEEILYFRHISC